MNMLATTPILSVAPMLDYTDRHYRVLARLFLKKTWLYTEMVTAAAIKHAEPKRRIQLLQSTVTEQALVLQLGGSDPEELADAVAVAEQWPYTAINLNVGCPSSRVQSGRFGACLMLEPERVAECVAAMQQATTRPVTVKTRLGVDEYDSYEFLTRFIATVADAGCRTFVLHARKAWLKGLSPKENRSKPPLNYARARQIKADFPNLAIHLNGGLSSWAECERVINDFDGLMIGRAAYHNPFFMHELEQKVYGVSSINLKQVFTEYASYMQNQMSQQAVPLATMARHLIPFGHGLPGAKQWRRWLSEETRPHRNAEDFFIELKKRANQLI